MGLDGDSPKVLTGTRFDLFCLPKKVFLFVGLFGEFLSPNVRKRAGGRGEIAKGRKRIEGRKTPFLLSLLPLLPGALFQVISKEFGGGGEQRRRTQSVFFFLSPEVQPAVRPKNFARIRFPEKVSFLCESSERKTHSNTDAPEGLFFRAVGLEGII